MNTQNVAPVPSPPNPPGSRGRRSRPAALAALAAVAAAAIALGSFALGVAPASAVENEPYTHGMRDTTGTANKPSEWFVYVGSGEELRVQAGSHDENGATDLAKNRLRAFFTITDPTGALVETNDSGWPASAPTRVNGISMLDPDDRQPAPIVANDATAGVYRVTLRNSSKDQNTSSFPWKLTVTANGEEQTGRVWMERYSMVEQWPGGPLTAGHPAYEGLDLDYWFVSAEGYRYRLDLAGFVGWTSVLSASLLGNTDAQCRSLYRSTVTRDAAQPDCDDRYKLFFEEPDAALPASAPIATASASTGTPSVGAETVALLPEPVEPELAFTGFTSANDPAAPKAGTFGYRLAHFAGNYSILIDADGDGDFSGAADREIKRSLVSGGEGLSLDFDGLDAAGAVIPESVTVAAQITVGTYPELHFVFNDVEQLAGGMTLTRLNGGTGPGGDLMHWNDVDEQEPPHGLGERSCSDSFPTLGDPANPATSYDPADPTVGTALGTPGVRSWRTTSNTCRDNDTAELGSYGNEKLLDTWTYANVSLRSELQVAGRSLHVAKAVDAGTAAPGQTMNYSVTLRNNGSAPFRAADGTPAVLKDDLGGVLGSASLVADSLTAAVDGAPAVAPTVTGATLSWLGDLEPGETATIGYAVTVGDAPAASLENWASALRSAADEAPTGAACAALTGSPSFNCASTATPTDAGSLAGPSAANATQRVAAGASVTFDVLGELVTAGASPELSLALLDPKTGEPVAADRVAVSGGVWTLDRDAGTAAFAADRDASGELPGIRYRVTDGNDRSADGSLGVTLIGAGAGTGPGGDGSLSTSGAESAQLALFAAVLLLAGGMFLAARRRSRGVIR